MKRSQLKLNLASGKFWVAIEMLDATSNEKSNGAAHKSDPDWPSKAL